MPKLQPARKPVVLVVIDGWGHAPPWGGNAISLARTPFMDATTKKYPNGLLQAAGQAVGLPSGERGNSEVGHLNIGSGQIVHQALPSISQSIADGTFFTNPALVEAFDRAKQLGRAVHLVGLVSDGGIHSHIDHLFALIDMGRQLGVTEIVIHAITDGRDSAPFISQEYLSRVNAKLREIGVGRIGTVSGRYYAMDRDHRWERTEKAYRAMTEGVGVEAHTAEGAVAAAYRDGFSDEFIAPTVIKNESGWRGIEDNDSVIFFNFRADRARELSQALINPKFDRFHRKVARRNLFFVGFTFFEEGLPMKVAFHPRDVNFPLARVISDAGWKQLHVAESEKYAHVTYFFNGGKEQPYKNEDRIVVPSLKVPSFDQTPAMSTPKIADEVISHLGSYDFIICNFANPDMVGHTGNLRATMAACESVDTSLSRIAKEVLAHKGTLFITADHGNAEQKVNPKTGEPDTEHTANPVPYILVAEDADKLPVRRSGALSDVAPTILELFGVAKPEEMTGTSLISHGEAAPVGTVATVVPATAPTAPLAPAAAPQA